MTEEIKSIAEDMFRGEKLRSMRRGLREIVFLEHWSGLWSTPTSVRLFHSLQSLGLIERAGRFIPACAGQDVTEWGLSNEGLQLLGLPSKFEMRNAHRVA